jgi:hypothetical protein
MTNNDTSAQVEAIQTLAEATDLGECRVSVFGAVYVSKKLGQELTVMVTSGGKAHKTACRFGRLIARSLGYKVYKGEYTKIYPCERSSLSTGTRLFLRVFPEAV